MKEERIVLLTGAGGGIGTGIAKRLLEEGYTVALHYRSKKDALVPLVEQYKDHAFLFQADFTDAESVRTFGEQVMGVLGRVDILINNAGMPSSGLSWKVSPEEWETVLFTNLTAPFVLSGTLIPGMRERKWGRILFFSSIVAQEGVAGTSSYAASKSGLIGLTRSMARELASKGITVNCIAPGYIDAGMISVIDEPARVELIRQTPAGRLGQASEIAAAVQYLISEEAAFTTGQVLDVNGGLSM